MSALQVRRNEPLIIVVRHEQAAPQPEPLGLPAHLIAHSFTSHAHNSAHADPKKKLPVVPVATAFSESVIYAPRCIISRTPIVGQARFAGSPI